MGVPMVEVEGPATQSPPVAGPCRQESRVCGNAEVSGRSASVGYRGSAESRPRTPALRSHHTISGRALPLPIRRTVTMFCLIARYSGSVVVQGNVQPHHRAGGERADLYEVAQLVDQPEPTSAVPIGWRALPAGQGFVDASPVVDLEN